MNKQKRIFNVSNIIAIVVLQNVDFFPHLIVAFLSLWQCKNPNEMKWKVLLKIFITKFTNQAQHASALFNGTATAQKCDKKYDTPSHNQQNGIRR